MLSSKSREMLCFICHITLGFFFFFGVDISVAVVSVHCFQQAHSWNEPVISVQPVPPRLAALPTWHKWQSPVHHPSLTSYHGSACSVSSHMQPKMYGTRVLRNTRPGRAADVKPLQLVTMAVGSPRDTCYKEPGRLRRKAALLKFLDLFLLKAPRHNRSPEFPPRDTTLSQA